MRLVRISRQAVPNEVFLHLANVTLGAQLHYGASPVLRTAEMVAYEDRHFHREGIDKESAMYQDLWRCAYRACLAVYIHTDPTHRLPTDLAREAAYDVTAKLWRGNTKVAALLARRGVY